jgi:hypothetical protein
MPRLATPPTISAVHVLSRHGISYIVFAVLAIAHAGVAQWMWQTVGEPFRAAELQNEQIQVTNALMQGTETRNLLQLQSGLSRAADLDSFNETLFDEAKALHRAMRTRMDALTLAVEKAQVAPLATALRAAIEPHTDGRPFIDRYHLRTAAKKLQAQAQAEAQAEMQAEAKAKAEVSEDDLSSLYAEVRGAIELSRGSENEAPKLEEEEKKLPSRWMPSFWVGCRRRHRRRSHQCSGSHLPSISLSLHLSWSSFGQLHDPAQPPADPIPHPTPFLLSHCRRVSPSSAVSSSQCSRTSAVIGQSPSVRSCTSTRPRRSSRAASCASCRRHIAVPPRSSLCSALAVGCSSSCTSAKSTRSSPAA